MMVITIFIAVVINVILLFYSYIYYLFITIRSLNT